MELTPLSCSVSFMGTILPQKQRERLEDIQKPAVDGRIARDNSGVLDPDVPTRKVGHNAAGFTDEQVAGSYVPGGEMLFPEPVEAAGSHVGQIERRRARSPDTARRDRHPTELVLVLTESRFVLERKSSADQSERWILNG